MSVSLSQQNELFVVTVDAPNLDAAQCDLLRDVVRQLPDSAQSWLLDLTAVRFLDSAGLGILLEISQANGHRLLGIVGISLRAARHLGQLPGTCRLPLFRNLREFQQRQQHEVRASARPPVLSPETPMVSSEVPQA